MSEELEAKDHPISNGYTITSWILGIIAILMTSTNAAGYTAVYLSVIGIIFGGIGFGVIERDKGKKGFTIIALIVNVLALLPFLF